MKYEEALALLKTLKPLVSIRTKTYKNGNKTIYVSIHDFDFQSIEDEDRVDNIRWKFEKECFHFDDEGSFDEWFYFEDFKIRFRWSCGEF